jgi:hypothetical protein
LIDHQLPAEQLESSSESLGLTQGAWVVLTHDLLLCLGCLTAAVACSAFHLKL